MQYTTDTTPTFEAFYERYVNLVRHVLSNKSTSCYEHIDDLTQETFMRAWKAYDQLDHLQNVRSWVCRIAHNTAIDFARHMQSWQRLDCPLETDNGMVHDIPDFNQGEAAVYVEESDAISYAYQRLCPDDQRVMAMLFQNYTPKEIAAALHLDRDVCRGRINRARRRFQKHYERA